MNVRPDAISARAGFSPKAMEDRSWFVALSGSAKNAGGRMPGKKQSAMGAGAVFPVSRVVGFAAVAARTIRGISRDARHASTHVREP